MNKLNNIQNNIEAIDDAFMKIIEVIILRFSRKRKDLYDDLNQRLSMYNERELLNLLKHDDIQIDKLSLEMIKDRFNYLKCKYEKLTPDINIELDLNDIYKSSFVLISHSLIVINPKQIFHLASKFNTSIEQTLEIAILHELGHILDSDVDIDTIIRSNKVFIPNAKHTINYRINKESSAWDLGKEFIENQDIKYRKGLFDLLKYYSIGCYILYYRNMVWCSLWV